MSASPNFFLTPTQFRLIKGQGDWDIGELSLEEARGIKAFFGSPSSFCVTASGNSGSVASGHWGRIVGGIDWIRHEDKPKPGEPDLNIYHFEITEEVDGSHPVFYQGANNTVGPHWAKLEDLSVYFRNWNNSNLP